MKQKIGQFEQRKAIKLWKMIQEAGNYLWS